MSMCVALRFASHPCREKSPRRRQTGWDKTAMRWTKSEYAFFVATYTDCQRIHNHIYYNSILRLMEESGAIRSSRCVAVRFRSLCRDSSGSPGSERLPSGKALIPEMSGMQLRADAPAPVAPGVSIWWVKVYYKSILSYQFGGKPMQLRILFF